MKLVTVAEMQEAERRAGVPVSQLMEKAGLAVAQEVWLRTGDLSGRRILVLVGPGNNGGDGLVAARQLREWGAEVGVYLLRPRGEDDPVFAAALQAGIPVALAEEDAGVSYPRLQEWLEQAEVVVDALLGTGRARPVQGHLAEILDRLRETRSRPLAPQLIAVDLPTGLDADTGAVDPHCVAADETVALGWSKVGLHTLPGSQYAGQVEVVDIGIPKELEASFQTELMSRRWARALLPPRPLGAHKGTFGRAVVVAGSPRYTGAAYLACMGAYRVGAGLVTLACGRSIHPILASKLTEATFEPLPDKEGALTAEEAYAVRQVLSQGCQALLVGPGLGQGGYVQAFVRALLPLLTPEETGLCGLVIDADGLNNLAGVEGWWRWLKVPAVVTPHPGEMSRLTGLSVQEIQRNRLLAASDYARQWGVTVVLKGANTVVAASDGRAWLSPFANPGLASGGTGDVLAGAIAGLIAQGVEPTAAASLGVFLHGLAGEIVRERLGSAGAVAGDILKALPLAIKDVQGE